jgi:flavin-dependent thymidylate synthase
MNTHQNLVTLINYSGGDQTHCLAAWQSTCFDNIERFESMYDYSVSEGINWIDTLYEDAKKHRKRSPEGLLRYLASMGHHTPFEQSLLQFQVRADMATHIHFLKHRIGVSINTESARYKELPDKWYLPSDWAQFDGLEINLAELLGVNELANESPDDLLGLLNMYANLGHQLYHIAVKTLEPVAGRKRAKECSRYFLPYCKQVDFMVAFNFRSFMHFQGLRNKEEAQLEVRAIANMMLDLVHSIPNKPFEMSLDAFGY